MTVVFIRLFQLLLHLTFRSRLLHFQNVTYCNELIGMVLINRRKMWKIKVFVHPFFFSKVSLHIGDDTFCFFKNLSIRECTEKTEIMLFTKGITSKWAQAFLAKSFCFLFPFSRSIIYFKSVTASLSLSLSLSLYIYIYRHTHIYTCVCEYMVLTNGCRFLKLLS